MKKSLLALAVLGAFAGAASAQSSVTLYGLIDASVTNQKNQGKDATKATVANPTGYFDTKTNSLDSGHLNGSRWGLRGREDLGGGMAADFVLESGFNIDTGSNADTKEQRVFSRTATVGLSGGFGAVTLGRSLTLLDDVRGSFIMERWDFDPTVAVWKEGGTDYTGRYDNRIRYVTPAMGGFFAGAEVSGESGNAVAAAGGNKSYAAKLGYAAGPINLQMALQSDKDAAAPHDAITYLTLLGSYNFGFATLGAEYNRENNKRTPGDDNATEWALGAKFPLGASAQVAFAYARSKVQGKDNTATGYGIEAQYNLSPRTKIYAGARSNKDDDVIPGTTDQMKDRIIGVGIQHRF